MAISLERERAGIRVHARTTDGAETSRLVQEPRSLSAVTFGLLAGIPTERAPVAPLYRPMDLRLPDPTPAPPVVPPFDLPSRIPLSLSTGTRAAFPTIALMGEFELRADFSVRGWLLTLGLRAAPIAACTRIPFDGDAFEETALAFGVGREVRVGRSAFQLTAGPALAYTWMETDNPSVSGEYAQLRLGAVARWGYPIRPNFRVLVRIDAEVVPRALVNDEYQAGLPPFPKFTTGLSFGGEVAL